MKKQTQILKDVELLLARHLTYKFANDCLNLMRMVEKENPQEITGSFLFLASNALELYAKSFMCLRWEKQDKLTIEEVKKRAYSFGHDLDRMYHYQGVGEEFLRSAGIQKVFLNNRQGKSGIKSYKFDFITSSGLVYVYAVESLRYGNLTPKQNFFTLFNPSSLIQLCESAKEALSKESKKYLI